MKQIRLIGVFVLALAGAGGAHAQALGSQNVPSDPVTAYDQAIDVPPDPEAPQTYDAPDIPKRWTHWSAYNGDEFSYKVTLVPIFDYDAFSQNAASLAQVGKQEDQWDIRSMRISIGGRFNFGYEVKYLLGVEYKGFDQPPGAAGWGTTDVGLTLPLGPPQFGSVSVGKIKETVSYEMVGDAANLPQLERVLNPFFTSRDVGIRYNNTLLEQQMTVSGGWFNDWWTKGHSYSGSSNHYSVRVTGVPYYAADGANYLHLGFSSRYLDATNGSMRLTAKPESNVTSNYLDTGSFAATSAMEYGFEALLNIGPASLLGEYIDMPTDAPLVGNPNFHGYYLTGSYVLTGEHRPYDRNVGYARRIIPLRPRGAWELIGRIGRVDLTDKAVHGGTMNFYSMNLTWWANRRLRISAMYGSYDEDQLGLTGNTQQFHARIQWVF